MSGSAIDRDFISSLLSGRAGIEVSILSNRVVVVCRVEDEDCMSAMRRATHQVMDVMISIFEKGWRCSGGLWKIGSVEVSEVAQTSM